MATKAESVRDLADKISSGNITVAGALTIISENGLVRAIDPIPSDPGLRLYLDALDAPGPDDNDPIHLDALRLNDTITIEDFEKMVEALNQQTPGTATATP